ncbi:hypothetical protein OH76DRAFT_1249896 [Lentinus brumalis]|uniref:Uncharacterized protein n=1 Tax=Lentinus brumalis TaxID=2498619 RepID=A0A371CRP9_9APHY|nr:hypothetical protein OH76DRAFT_1249896 [Polyporus brumalis]
MHAVRTLSSLLYNSPPRSATLARSLCADFPGGNAVSLRVVHPFCERGPTCQLVDNRFMLRQSGSRTSGQQYGSGQKFAATLNVEHCTGAGTSIKSGSRSTSSWRQTPATGCPRRPFAPRLLRGVEREPCLQAASTNTRISCFSGTEKSARFHAA